MYNPVNSTYTMTLDEIAMWQGEEVVKSYFTQYELSDFLTSEQIEVIENQGIWNKEKLAEKIVDFYRFREIGSETIGQFKHRAKVRMRQIMEIEAQRIYSAALKYDPLVNVDFTETYDYTRESDGTADSSSNDSGLGVNSDTPQGQISKTQILEGKYATSTTATESESGSHSESTGNITDHYTRNQKGNSGALTTSQALVEKYRDVIISADNEVIEQLSNIFMGIY